MNKLFGLALLALAFLAPDAAYAVNCFWVGGAGTWDNSAITHWAPTTGGAATGCQTSNAAPAAGDAITFDGSSGGGTVTPNGTVAGIAFGSLTAGAFTGTLAFNTNNPNMSFTGQVNFSGAGARTIDMGSGTWTLTGNGTVFDGTAQTNCTACVYTAAISLTGNNNNRTWNNPNAGLTFGSFTIGNNTATGLLNISGAHTVSSLTMGSGVLITLPQFQNLTVSGAMTITGTASNPSGIITNTPATTTQSPIVLGASSTAVWAVFMNVIRSGAGALTATNSLDLGRNSSITITPPSVGGGGGRGIIGG